MSEHGSAHESPGASSERGAVKFNMDGRQWSNSTSGGERGHTTPVGGAATERHELKNPYQDMVDIFLELDMDAREKMIADPALSNAQRSALAEGLRIEALEGLEKLRGDTEKVDTDSRESEKTKARELAEAIEAERAWYERVEESMPESQKIAEKREIFDRLGMDKEHRGRSENLSRAQQKLVDNDQAEAYRLYEQAEKLRDKAAKQEARELLAEHGQKLSRKQRRRFRERYLSDARFDRNDTRRPKSPGKFYQEASEKSGNSLDHSVSERFRRDYRRIRRDKPGLIDFYIDIAKFGGFLTAKTGRGAYRRIQQRFSRK